MWQSIPYYALLWLVGSSYAASNSTTTPSITAAPNAKASCPANCTVMLNEIGFITWSSIKLQTTVTYKVILVVDEYGHTETSTSTVDVPKSLKLFRPANTNAKGTVTAVVTIDGSATELAYPTAHVKWPKGYSVTGTFNTTSTCLANPFITYDAKAMASLTQPPASIPSGGDEYGLLWTTTLEGTNWPKEWISSRVADQLAWRVCSVENVAPAASLQGALVLTETSVSSKKGGQKPTTSPPAKQSDTQKSPPQSQKSDAKPASPVAQTTAPQTLAIGSQTLSVGYVANPTSQSQAPASAKDSPQPNTPSKSAPAVVIVGSNTIPLGSTTVVNGVTVVATSASGKGPQLLVGGASGTSTVQIQGGGAQVSAGGNKQTSSGGIGGYIASGLDGGQAGTKGTATGTGLQQFTGSAGRVRGEFLWWIVGVLGMVGLA